MSCEPGARRLGFIFFEAAKGRCGLSRYEILRGSRVLMYFNLR